MPVARTLVSAVPALSPARGECGIHPPGGCEEITTRRRNRLRHQCRGLSAKAGQAVSPASPACGRCPRRERMPNCRAATKYRLCYVDWGDALRAREVFAQTSASLGMLSRLLRGKPFGRKLALDRGFRIACRAALGAIPAVQLFRHMEVFRPIAAPVAATLDPPRNVAVESHGVGFAVMGPNRGKQTEVRLVRTGIV